MLNYRRGKQVFGSCGLQLGLSFVLAEAEYDMIPAASWGIEGGQDMTR